MVQRRASRVGVALCASAMLAWPTFASAQFTEAPPPAAYALRNVTVVAADGSRVEGATIVVRGRFLEALGPAAAVPADARVLEGDSLYLYPGLIDGWGTVKYEFPKEDVDRSKVQPWDPPRSLQGFQPHRRVVDYLTATGTDVADLRRKGVVAVAVQPDGSLMPGRGAVLVLRPDAKQPSDLVVDPALGPVMTFKPARGAYPATMMGMIAWYRQTFMDAARRAQVASAAERDPRGLTPPGFDPDYAVVQQAMGGGTPVYWVADSENDIRRMLRLADEFRLKPVLVGGEEAWKLALELKTRDIPVLVSVDFPKPKQWKPEAPAKPAAPDSAAATPDTTKAPAGPKEPMRPAAVREKERLEDAYATAGRLAAAGVRVALVTNQGKADLLAGARKAIEYGMSESAALRALTSTPAALYGIPSIARVEKGLPATFIVTDGPLFGKDTKVVYTFVDGGLEKGAEGGKKSAAAAGEAAAVAGTWSFEILGSGAPPPGTLKMTQEGGTFTGTIDIPSIGEFPVKDGKVNGSDISFTVEVTMGGQSTTVDFHGSVSGDSMSGNGSGEGVGDFDWRAQRTPGPGGEQP